MQGAVAGEGEDGRDVVTNSTLLFPKQKKEESVRDVVNKAGGKTVLKWCHWFCKTCGKVGCACEFNEG